MRKSVVSLATAITVLAVLPALASGSPYIHAHRGGPLKTVGGELRPAFPENSIPAFRSAGKAGFVLEMDTRLTADGRAVVMHDASLKRTTTCTGLVSERTLAEIRSECVIDIIGTDEASRHLGKRGRPPGEDPDDDPGPRARSQARRRRQSRDQQLSDGPGFRPDLAARLRAHRRRADQGQRISTERSDPAELPARQRDPIP